MIFFCMCSEAQELIWCQSTIVLPYQTCYCLNVSNNLSWIPDVKSAYLLIEWHSHMYGFYTSLNRIIFSVIWMWWMITSVMLNCDLLTGNLWWQQRCLTQRAVSGVQLVATLTTATSICVVPCLMVSSLCSGMNPSTSSCCSRSAHCFFCFVWIILTSLFSTCGLYRDRQKPANGTRCPTLMTNS